MPKPPLPCTVCGQPSKNNWIKLCDEHAKLSCVQCGEKFARVSVSSTRKTCSDGCLEAYYGWAPGTAEKLGSMSVNERRAAERERRAIRSRNKCQRRRAKGRESDVTPEWQQQLRDRTRKCPLCEAKLTNDQYKSTSKELDHIVPINQGGTHTMGNVRIVCRDCNLKRPNDGSDIVGPVTLWAQVDGVIKAWEPPKRAPKPPKVAQYTCGTCGAKTFTPTDFCRACSRARGEQAAQKRAAGMGWQEIADALFAEPGGIGRSGSAYLAAEAHAKRQGMSLREWLLQTEVTSWKEGTFLTVR